jgi:hypothetical protein
MAARRTVQMSKFSSLLVTRDRGRAVAEALPPKASLTLDFRGVKVASPSFLDELVKASRQRAIRLAFANLPPRARTSLNRLERLHPVA